MYDIKHILTICPHCYNIFKNEYPDLGSEIGVVNYIDFLNENIESGKLKIDRSLINGMSVTYHDPCYLGRGNEEYEQPRRVLKALVPEIREMHRNRSHALCCGAGGGQMFKEAEKGDREIFLDRTGEALETGASVIATACPFCMTMMTDGIKYRNREEDVRNFDIAELVVQSLGI